MTRIQYGYIGNDSLVDYDKALMELQERYNLFVDEKLSEETVTLMNRARCIVGENSFRVASKWNKTHLVWYFPQANEEYRKLVKKAFEIWEEKSNLKFSYVLRLVPVKLDITITVQKRDHWFRANYQGRYKCLTSFDGPGVVLAHSYLLAGNQCREIHIDADENWYLGPENKILEVNQVFY